MDFTEDLKRAARRAAEECRTTTKKFDRPNLRYADYSGEYEASYVGLVYRELRKRFRPETIALEYPVRTRRRIDLVFREKGIWIETEDGRGMFMVEFKPIWDEADLKGIQEDAKKLQKVHTGKAPSESSIGSCNTVPWEKSKGREVENSPSVPAPSGQVHRKVNNLLDGKQSGGIRILHLTRRTRNLHVIRRRRDEIPTVGCSSCE